MSVLSALGVERISWSVNGSVCQLSGRRPGDRCAPEPLSEIGHVSAGAVPNRGRAMLLEREPIRLLDVDPVLGAALAPERRAPAERALVVSTCCLQVRAWEASRTAGAGGAAVVLEGAASARADRRRPPQRRAAGPGRLDPPPATGRPHRLLPADTQWSVLSLAVIAHYDFVVGGLRLSWVRAGGVLLAGGAVMFRPGRLPGARLRQPCPRRDEPPGRWLAAHAGVFSVHDGLGSLAIALVYVCLLAATSSCSCARRRRQPRIGAGDAPRAAGCSARRRRLRCRTAARGNQDERTSMNRSPLRGRRAAPATPPPPEAAASSAFVPGPERE